MISPGVRIPRMYATWSCRLGREGQRQEIADRLHEYNPLILRHEVRGSYPDGFDESRALP